MIRGTLHNRLGVVLSALLMLGACERHENTGSTPAAEPSAAATKTVATAPAATPACAPAPTLDESDDFSDPRDVFTVDSPEFARLEANFAAAYAKACAHGLFAKEPLIPRGAPHPATLFAITAPEANDASIYRASDEQATPGDMVLEYYFITPDGTKHVPTEADLSEAIYCTVHGASDQEQAESGRCLVD